MLRYCEYCGMPMETAYPNKHFCSKKCADKAYYERDESFYDFLHLPDAEPLFSFQCKNCGKEVKVFSIYDQRISYCCGKCAKAYNNRQKDIRAAKPRGSNIGMSGGMSLGSLIRREAKDLRD